MHYNKSFAYAVATVSQLAAQNPATPLSCGVICNRTGMPHRFLLQICNKLVEAGIVVSRRGPQGGYILSRPATEITLASVFEAIQPVHENDDLPLEGFAAASRKLIDSTAKRLAADIRERLATLTVADLKSTRETARMEIP